MKSQKNKNDDQRRNLTSVSRLLVESDIKRIIVAYSRPVVLKAIQDVLDHYRTNIKAEGSPPDIGDIVAKVEERLIEIEADRLRPVVNATGIILHTGLGRAVLPQRAVDALAGQNRLL